ncbi:Uncharacterized protein ALO70_02039 [Pseudomonas amygdali pv. eriobotryae]|uniref:4-hydroxyphenylacetate 3-monooxygenase n=1 Tax=Pseudomonas amygdali pv. eriobotryae TaxID=129137 RepID=A0A0P9V1Z4_PSEA0|nr:4-hydroxyphenylacetate 3-hydroxylase N-terminal domain-containing protein [Pseudomonas amygdali]KPX31914.1 Uncharacterized protein ALO70_02039 [Pseudomonas amygdali pv. eriobotryae]KWS78358.1 hypothetical protein AL052_01100 [Pseudomonas amygdali pv. eriobotryae]RML95298.1 hypothetical protein ALQ86_01753 [Pseudomonas amygdali pv. eriobotryae]RMO48406.1 hypothetical protein ALQ39_00585 [Pseudomonas amygdali pv. eriobotryae]GFZ73856.1 siderophore biosynthesis-related protein [Pseudomonas amy
MLKSGKQHLESLRDGRVVYVGSERVDDVTTHPAFRNGAKTVASIYDMKADARYREDMGYEEDGQIYSSYFKPARTTHDLEQRNRAHKRIADMTYGMFGRSPDHVSSFVTGMSLKPEVFDKYGDNLLAYYKYMRENDIFACYAVLSPQSSRNPELYKANGEQSPALRVVRQDEHGVVISGMKMLATGAIFANEIFIGNLLPLAEEQRAESITCAVPCNAPGLSLWSRKPIEPTVSCEFEGPLASRYDETDAMLICEEVHVPWDKVFVHNDTARARQIYIQTAGHAYGNHQSNVRFLSKLQLIVGLASRITQATGADKVPAVRELLGRLAAQEALLSGLIQGQIHSAENYPVADAKCFNRRYVYAALSWCTESYSGLIDILRELCGGGVFQMPADISVIDDPELNAIFQHYWNTPQMPAVDRMKLFKLAWDLVGSEFAGRHQQYEKFYAGASFIVKNYSFMHADWAGLHDVTDKLLESYTVPHSASLSATN